MPSRGLIFVISGPSGSGKTTLMTRLVRQPGLRARLIRSVSLTTRPRRSQEREGKDYFFLSPAQFRQRLRAKKILEWTKYLGYYYATPKEFVEQAWDRGKHLVLCLDIPGARQIRTFYPGQTVTIFVMPPSLDLLEARISNRCSRTKRTEVLGRIAQAKKEMLYAAEYNYCIVNEHLSESVKELARIVKAELTRKV